MNKSLGCTFCVHSVDGDGPCLISLPVPSCGVGSRQSETALCGLVRATVLQSGPCCLPWACLGTPGKTRLSWGRAVEKRKTSYKTFGSLCFLADVLLVLSIFAVHGYVATDVILALLSFLTY